MPKKFHWDLIRVLAICGGILGVFFTISFILNIWGPIGGFLAPDVTSSTIQIILCGIIIVGWGILGWDI